MLKLIYNLLIIATEVFKLLCSVDKIFQAMPSNGGKGSSHISRKLLNLITF